MSISIPAADWQNASLYEPLTALDRAGLAWEFVRRDPAYRATIVRLGAVSARTGGVEIVPPGFPGADPWGLSFR